MKLHRNRRFKFCPRYKTWYFFFLLFDFVAFPTVFTVLAQSPWICCWIMCSTLLLYECSRCFAEVAKLFAVTFKSCQEVISTWGCARWLSFRRKDSLEGRDLKNFSAKNCLALRCIRLSLYKNSLLRADNWSHSKCELSTCGRYVCQKNADVVGSFLWRWDNISCWRKGGFPSKSTLWFRATSWVNRSPKGTVWKRVPTV